MALASRTLVGREHELRVLEGAIAAAESGSAQMIQIAGDPGIGKTSLLAAAAEQADGRHWLVLGGRATELERQLPFGAVVDALDPYLGSLQPRIFDPLGNERRSQLAAIFPALADLAPRAEGLQEERYRSHHAVRALLELLASRRPCLLALDDLHWADQATLELVAHLLRRRPAGPVLVLLAFRPGQAPPELQRALDTALGEDASERIALGPLTREQADELLGDGIPAELRATIERDAGGNPFYLEQLAGAAERGLAPRAEADEGAGVPSSVRRALAAELGVLGPEARLAVQAAAVAGEPFAPDSLAAVAGMSDAEALAAIDEALELGLVRPTDTPRWFAFRHPIVRRAVYESAGAAWRIGAHARAAEELERTGAPAASRAHHVERSARAGDVGAVDVLARAASETASLAPATAARWLQAALTLLPPGSEADGKRLELLVPLAHAQGSTGRLDDSRRTLESLLELLSPDLAAVRGRVAGFIAVIDHLRGRHGEARASLERALAELPDSESAEAASLRVELASDRFFVGDWRGMREQAARADAIARALGEPGPRATAAAILALAEYSGAHIPAARALMDEAATLVDAAADRDLRLDAFDWLGWCELSMERYESALAHLERGLAIGRRSGQGSLLMTMRFGRVFGMTSLGRLDAAAAESDETLELARVSGSDQLMSWALCLRSWLMLRAGELEQALRLGEESRSLAAAVTSNPFSTVGAGWLAEALVESGAPARGRDALLDALGGPELPLIERPFHPYLYDVLTGAELALGRIEAAGDWAALAEASLDGIDLDGRRSFALRARASVSLACGDAAGAARLALQAAEAAGQAHRVDAARCLLLAGRALASAGDREGAITRLEHARAELDACGAARYRDQVVRELRRLGMHVPGHGRRGSAADGLAALSGRELEVAGLVTDRLTNREIAERLVLSEKTVERHMSRIFQKLGVSSRVEVARLVDDQRETASADGA